VELAVHDLNARYGARHTLFDVTLELNTRQLLANTPSIEVALGHVAAPSG
jgi:hypothetical protein